MKILVLTSGTGGGHNARALAFKKWASLLEPDWEVEILQALEETHGLYRFGVGVYNTIQKTLPRVHHVYFHFLEITGMHRNPQRLLGRNGYIAFLRHYRPDVVLSTHAHLNHAYFDVAREALGRGNVRCVTYCGELSAGAGFSRHWINPDVDMFIGSVQETARMAMEQGMNAEHAVAGGLLLAPEFYDETITEQDCRSYLAEIHGFNPEQFTLLLATGLAGANNHMRLLRQLEKRGVPIQVVALCSHSSRTLDQIRNWAEQQGTVRVSPIPYTDKMPLLLKAVSAIVTRPGSATTSEAILSTCPVIFNGIGGIMPQERLTVKYAGQYHFSETINRPADLYRILDLWQSDPERLEAQQSAMRQAIPPGHPRDILRKSAEI